MKKTLITILTVAALVAIFGGISPAYAMEDAGKGPGNGGNGNGSASNGANGTSVLSPYMNIELANALGLDLTEVEDRLASGETCYDIALSMGYTAEFLPTFINSLQERAANAAAADGITQQTQLNTNLGTQSQLNDGICDGTGSCLQSTPTANPNNGTNAGTRGYRGGH